MKEQLLYRLYLRTRRHWMPLSELAQKDDITLGEYAILVKVKQVFGR